MTLALRYAARTHLGLGPKSRNEDSGYAGPHLLVLADGMGGHAAGDVASSMIVGALAHLDGEGLSAEQGLRALEDELANANAGLRRAISENEDLAGMGSTTIAMLRSGSKLAMAHIGDSRAYLLRDGVFTQITKDHSFVQQLVDESRITQEEAVGHPQRSLVTRVMTGNPDDHPDLSVRELRVGDRYLLCSDGLSDFVSGDVIQEVLTKAPSPEDAAERLVEVAVRASARDNITVVLADVVDLDSQPATETVPQVVGAAADRRRRRRTRAIPVSPAEKAAALTREVSGTPAEDDGVMLAEESRGHGTRWLRWVGLAAVLVLVVVGGGYAAYQWTQRQYFVGQDEGYVAVYRGVNQSLGAVGLSSPIVRSEVLVSDLPNTYQASVRSTIPVGSREEADARVQALAAAAAECRVQRATGQPCTTTTDSTAGQLSPSVTASTSASQPTGIPTPTGSPT
ncbi:MAG: PP2C family protein-serine/threonine phosphatase [Dermatophilaceae bacterium]